MPPNTSYSVLLQRLPWNGSNTVHESWDYPNATSLHPYRKRDGGRPSQKVWPCLIFCGKWEGNTEIASWCAPPWNPTSYSTVAESQVQFLRPCSHGKFWCEKRAFSMQKNLHVFCAELVDMSLIFALISCGFSCVFRVEKYVVWTAP